MLWFQPWFLVVFIVVVRTDVIHPQLVSCLAGLKNGGPWFTGCFIEALVETITFVGIYQGNHCSRQPSTAWEVRSGLYNQDHSPSKSFTIQIGSASLVALNPEAMVTCKRGGGHVPGFLGFRLSAVGLLFWLEIDGFHWFRLVLCHPFTMLL